MKALIATSQNKINAFQRVHKKRKESHALNHRQYWLCIISLKGRYIHASQFVNKKTAHEVVCFKTRFQCMYKY